MKLKDELYLYCGMHEMICFVLILHPQHLWITLKNYISDVVHIISMQGSNFKSLLTSNNSQKVIYEQ